MVLKVLRRSRLACAHYPSLVLAVGLLLFFCCPADGQIQGRVSTSDTGEPAAQVAVTVLDQDGDTVATTLTRDDGRFAIFETLARGEHLIAATRLGFETAWTLFDYAGAPLAFEFRIFPAPIALEGIDVKVEAAPIERKLAASGFYQRAQSAFGHHAEFTDVNAKLGATNPSHLMRRIPGIAVSRSGEPHFTRVQGSSIRTGPVRLCEPLVWVDGTIARGPFDRISPPVEDILAIEAYPSGSTTPPQWRGDGSACGTILIWTR